MNRVWIVAALSFLMLPFASAARAQDASHIAVCNPVKIFNGMQETKDLQQKMKADSDSLTAQEQAKVQDIQSLQAALKVLVPGSQQYQDKNKEYNQKLIELDAWKKLNQMSQQEDQKTQMKALFDKIIDATKAVADAEKIDLVIVENTPEISPELFAQINVDQYRQALSQRTVMYSSGKLDISDKIIAKLDADYKAKK